jgi:trehalose-phosphatase
MMEHLFTAWRPFLAAIRAAPHIILLSDYDGTLTEIVSRPEQAILSPEMKTRLCDLTARPLFSIGIISGRSLAEIKSMVGISGIYYAGNHGFEIEGPGLKFTNPAAREAQAEIKKLTRKLSARLSHIRGVIVEDKGLSLSVHYRLVNKNDHEMVAGIFHEITSPRENKGKIRITSGKKVWEVRPPIDWHKGKAIEAISQAIRKIRRSEPGPTIYLGDDTTDEDAFRVIHRPEGWSVFVGREDPASSAEYYLNSTAEVAAFFSRLLEMK